MENAMNKRFLILLFLFLPACGPAVSAQTLTAADTTAIYSAVAHFHFEPGHKLIEDRQWPVIYVSPKLGIRPDPGPNRYEGDLIPADLLPRLRDLSPRVEIAALVDVIQTDRGNAVKEDGLWVGFGKVQVESNEVIVRFETFRNGKDAVGYEYRLARQGDRWTVVKAALGWIA